MSSAAKRIPLDSGTIQPTAPAQLPPIHTESDFGPRHLRVARPDPFRLQAKAVRFSGSLECLSPAT